MTAASSPLDALLDSLPRTSLVVGKGGVGKTTLAVGLATSFARRHQRTLVVSTDPAAALAETLGTPVGADASSVSGEPNLDARQLSAPELRRAFLDRWRDVIADIVDRGTYLDRGDVDGLVDAALPGVDEIFGLLALADVLADPSAGYERIVIDTAPTGHTLRLLALPGTFGALLSMLDVMQDKHRFMVRALTHRYRRDRADDFLIEMRTRIDGLRAALANPHAVAAVVVTRAERMVAAETRRYIGALGELNVSVAAVVVNALAPNEVPAPIEPSVPTYSIPQTRVLLTNPSAIVDTLARLTDRPTDQRRPRTARHRVAENAIATTEATAAASPVTEPATTPAATRHRRTVTNRNAPSIDYRALTIVGGKGGVGKTTVACALAIAAADADGAPTLLVSTDPAPSIADAFGAPDADWARADIEHVVREVPGLVVRQMDATAAFTRLRDEYQTRIDALFGAVVARGVDVERDRAVMRDLFTLAPPGIDELFALSILGDALADGRFIRIVVDPAPTGHLLRLLDMPAVALDWSHRLMRLMLKYRDIIGLGDAAQELLDFAKRTRALDALLRDRARCTVIVAALDEPVVRAETMRLAAAIRARAIDVSTVIWNRTKQLPAPLTDLLVARQLFADEVVPSPTGVAALRAWSHSWSELPSNT